MGDLTKNKIMDSHYVCCTMFLLS